MGRRRRGALPSNIRATKYGIEVYTAAGGRFRSKHFPFTRTLTTPAQLVEAYDVEIRAWLAIHQTSPEKDRKAGKGTMLGDLADYLQARAAMPTIAEREQHLREWIAILGEDTRRRLVTALHIQQQRDRWLTVGPKRIQVKGKTAQNDRWVRVDQPLSPSSVNNRLRALENYYTVLDGRQGYNPVREVDEAHEPEGVPRSVSYPALLKIFEHVSDRPLRPKGSKEQKLLKADKRSFARARIEVLIWTGITSKELARLAPHDIHWQEKYLVVRDRRKGAGAPGRLVPLVPEAIAALTRFEALTAYGAFHAGVLLRAWQRACVAAKQPKLRLYDVRHSFITGYLRATKDLGQAQLIAGHKHAQTTRRYAAAAILPTLEAGMAAFGQYARLPIALPRSSPKLKRSVMSGRVSGAAKGQRKARKR